jgi:MFS family permease
LEHFQRRSLLPGKQDGRRRRPKNKKRVRWQNLPAFVLRLQLQYLTLQSALMTNEQKSGARTALALLLAINLFNYIDRYVLASVLPTLKHEFLAGDPNQNGKAGLWTTAFLISYMFTAPIFGWLADRFSRWILIGTSVAIWSLASGWSGLATSFAVLLCTRLFVGIGEAGYGPAAPTIIADLYPIKTRGRVHVRMRA